MRTDEHCHILWGVDDGSDSWDTTQAMLQQAKQSGIQRIVCTPHMRWSDFDQKKIQQHFAKLQESASGVELVLGYEVFYDRLMRVGIEHAPEFTVADTNRILIEWDTGGAVAQDWERTIYRMQSKYGLQVTIAHPERYSTVWEDWDTVYRFADMGCRMQVSAGDLFLGHFSKVAKCAKRLIKEGLCDALVSDAHKPEHYGAYRKAVLKYGK